MFKNKPLIVLTLALLLALTAIVAAQDVEPTGETIINPNANISWPPPVYVLRGEVAIRGSANVANMTNYFVGYRPLAEDLTIPDEEAPFVPALLPTAAAVQDDVLGTWDTTTVPDGLYELQLTINIQGGDPIFFRVSPIRVENELPPFVASPTPQASPTPAPTLTPPPPPATATPSTPRVTANVDANVRSGDSTLHPRIGTLRNGESADILGISSLGSGWYLIQLPAGGRGWISGSVVDVSGDLSGVHSVNPPPVPTPAATATPTTPPTSANLVIDAVTIDPFPLVCGQTATVRVTIRNAGNGATNSGGAVFVQDIHVSSGQVQQSTSGTFGVLNPGQTFVSQMFLTVSTFYNERHRINITIDSNNQVAETNDSDNFWSSEYDLARANCG